MRSDAVTVMAAQLRLEPHELERLVGASVDEAKSWLAERDVLLREVNLDRGSRHAMTTEYNPRRITAQSRSGVIERWLQVG